MIDNTLTFHQRSIIFAAVVTTQLMTPIKKQKRQIIIVSKSDSQSLSQKKHLQRDVFNK